MPRQARIQLEQYKGYLSWDCNDIRIITRIYDGNVDYSSFFITRHTPYELVVTADQEYGLSPGAGTCKFGTFRTWVNYQLTDAELPPAQVRDWLGLTRANDLWCAERLFNELARLYSTKQLLALGKVINDCIVDESVGMVIKESPDVRAIQLDS